MNNSEPGESFTFKAKLFIWIIADLFFWGFVMKVTDSGSQMVCPILMLITFFIGLGVLYSRDKKRLEEIERRQAEAEKRREEQRREDEEQRRLNEARRRQAEFARHDTFLQHFFVIMAKLAKADGVVVASEVVIVDKLFTIYNIPVYDQRKYKELFNQAIRDCSCFDLYQNAEQIASSAKDEEARVFVYECLWDVACADGVLAAEEKDILRRLCAHLRINSELYYKNYTRRRGSFVDAEEQSKKDEPHDKSRHNQSSQHTSIDDDYAFLGCTETSSFDEVQSAYRKMAKSYHPDILRANNVPEDLVEIANSKMIKLNEVWERIRKARGIQ